MSLSLTAANTPTPIATATPAIGQPVTPFPTPVAAGTSLLFNQAMAALQVVCQSGGGGYGIVTGCALTVDTGLKILVGLGIVVGDKMIELVASSASGSAPFYQVNVPASYTLADNATNYVWLTSTGALVSATTKTYPAGAKWFLGTVTTVSGAITNIDTSGRMLLSGGQFTRTTADPGPPTDAPASSLRFFTKTSGGTYFWDGTSHLPVGVDRIAIVPLAAVDTGGGIFSWQNPESVSVAIESIEVDITTVATGACSIDIGTTSVSGVTASDNLIDGLDIHTAAGLYGIQDQAGPNGKSRQKLASGKWVTGSKDSGASAGIVGWAYIKYRLLNA